MKRIIIKKLGHIAVIGLGIFAFSSCLKDQGPVQDFSQSPPVISFQGNGQGTNFSAISVLPTTTQSNPLVDSIGVSLGVSSLYLSKSVDVTVTADQATRVVVKFLEQAPELLHQDFRALAIVAFQRAWPCGPDHR